VSLRAPIAVTVEVRAAGRRVFRLAENLGEDGIALERPAPFDIGRPVEVTFALPDDPALIRLPARLEVRGGDEEEDREPGLGGRALTFLAVGEDDRQRLQGYVRERLDLPELPR
jgi:hypothetical protein